MNYSVIVNCFKSVNEAGAEELRLVLREFTLASQVKTKVTTEQEIHHQVQVLTILKRVVGINDELGINHG